MADCFCFFTFSAEEEEQQVDDDGSSEDGDGGDSENTGSEDSDDVSDVEPQMADVKASDGGNITVLAYVPGKRRHNYPRRRTGEDKFLRVRPKRRGKGDPKGPSQ